MSPPPVDGFVTTVASSRLVETRPTGAGRARGLVSSRSSGRRVEARTFDPSEDLRDVVAQLWIGRWDLRRQEPHMTELLGDPCVHVVFEASDTHAEGRLVGVWTRLWRRKLEGRGLVRGAKIRAGAARAFLETPAHRFANRITQLEDIAGADREALEGTRRRVLRPRDDAEGLAALERWLRARRRPDASGHTSLAVALVDRVVRDPGMTTMATLAKASGLSPRVLQRLFRDHVGASPKWVIRRHRLQEVAVRIERGEVISLADLAADLGYTDQAHLARDFKSAVGKSPSAFATMLKRG